MDEPDGFKCGPVNSYGISLEITIELVKEQGDGSACEFCGDVCYLEQHRLQVFANGQPCQPIGPEVVYCSSCAEVIKDRMEENS